MKKINWMTFMKLAALSLMVAALAFTGIALGINGLREAEYRYASFDKNATDFFVMRQGEDGKSNLHEDDVAVLKTQSFIYDAVGFHNLPKTVSGKSNFEEINLLFARDLTHAQDIGFFNRDTLMKGSLSGDGIYLDKKAADSLGVDIGDTVSYPFSGAVMQVKVTAIFLPCYIKGLDQGVALLRWTDAHAAGAVENFPYAFVMINASNNAQTYEYLVENGFLTFNISVLANVRKDVAETADVYAARATQSNIALAVSATVIFAAFGILLVLMDIKSDLNSIAKGKKSADILRSLFFRYGLAATAAVVLSGGFGVLYAGIAFWFDNYLIALLLPALLPLAGLLVLYVFLFVYYKKMLERSPVSVKASMEDDCDMPEEASSQVDKEEDAAQEDNINGNEENTKEEP